MDCAKGAAVAGLCDDVMVDILSRVPVKDLRRSTCVSKPWRDLITDPLHRKKLPQTLEGFFYNGAGDHSYGHFISLSGRGESAPPVDPSFSFLTAKLPCVKHMVLLDSCNGLLLFRCTRKNKFGYIVCNPATEELVTVPASSGSCPAPPPTPLEESNGDVYGEDGCAYTYLMFDPVVSSHFHLVQFEQDNSVFKVKTVRSYSSETRAWSDTSNKWEAGEEHGGWGVTGVRGEAILEFTRGRAVVNGLTLFVEAALLFLRGRALVKGLLHFVAYHYWKMENLIVAVDGEGTICRIICSPVKHGDVIAFIGQSQGHLHCIIISLQSEDLKFHFTQLSVWVLEDYDAQEWILKHNLSSSQLFGPLSWPNDNKNHDIVAIHPDHNSIILGQHWNQKLVSYDAQEWILKYNLSSSQLFGPLSWPNDNKNHDIVAIHPDHNSIILVQHWNQKLVSYDMDCKELRALCTLGRDCLFITPYIPYFMESPVLATKD